MKSISYYTCDVFTQQQFGGNQLAVIPNGSGLSTQQMQQIAREFNYSETTFVLPAQHGNTAQVRIFTPEFEMPFAGHPNVGTAITLAQTGALGEFASKLDIVFEEKAGLVPMTITKLDNGFSAELQAPEPLQLGDEISEQTAANLLSLSATQIVCQTHQPRTASVGFAFFMIELADLTALANAKLDKDTYHQLVADTDVRSVYLYCRTGEGQIRARMYAEMDGIPEDPATGSAAVALAGLLADYEIEQDGAVSYEVWQGVEMGRASQLLVRANKQNGKVSHCWVAGQSVLVSKGEFFLAD